MIVNIMHIMVAEKGHRFRQPLVHLPRAVCALPRAAIYKTTARGCTVYTSLVPRPLKVGLVLIARACVGIRSNRANGHLVRALLLYLCPYAGSFILLYGEK